MTLIESTGQCEPSYPSLEDSTSTLVCAVQELSLAHTLDELMKIVRVTARTLAHADGATFVLRDNEQCFYADEDAIGPLWKGMKFSMQVCISGWCMLHKEQVVIGDIFQDERIPHDVYRATFVKSLVMTPIRAQDPIGAIGCYWASHYEPTAHELDVLRALADACSTAMRNLDALSELKQRAKELERADHQLNRLAWMAYHDLKEPLRHMNLYTSLLEADMNAANSDRSADPSALQRNSYLEKIKSSCQQARQLVTDLHSIALVRNREPLRRKVALSTLLDGVVDLLEPQIEQSNAEVQKGPMPEVSADPVLLSKVLQNLLSNALKFHRQGSRPSVQIEGQVKETCWQVCVRDNGIGIDADDQEKVFDYFRRLHGSVDYTGSGVGLAQCKSIVEDMGGEIWVESTPGKGSCFSFTLPRSR